MTDSIPLKQCSRKENCVHPDGPWLPATTEYFGYSKTGRSGLKAECKRCILRRNREWIAKNKEKHTEYHRQYYESHAEEQREYHRKYRAENPDKVREINRKQYNKHPEKMREYSRNYQAVHKEQKRKYLNNYRKENPGKVHHWRLKREHSSFEDFTKEDVKRQLLAQTDEKGRLHCWLCGRVIEGQYHIDHWIPLSRGGTNKSDNIRIMHPRCNLKKHAKTPLQAGMLL